MARERFTAERSFFQDVTGRRQEIEAITLLIPGGGADRRERHAHRQARDHLNPAFVATRGYARAEVLGKTPRILKSGLHLEARRFAAYETQNDDITSVVVKVNPRNSLNILR